MNEMAAGLLRFMVRAVVLGMGLLLFLSLLAAAMVLAVGWLLRAGWSRLTGRPVNPWVVRVDPRKGFGAVFASTRQWPSTAAEAGPAEGGRAEISRRAGVLPGAGDVTDVEAREVR